MIFACTDNGFFSPPPPGPYNLMTGNLDEFTKDHASERWAWANTADFRDHTVSQSSSLEPETIHDRALIQQQQWNTTPTIHPSRFDELCSESICHGFNPSDTSFQSIDLTPRVVVAKKHPTVPKPHGTNLELQRFSPIQNLCSPPPTRRNVLLVLSNKPSLQLTPELSNTGDILKMSSFSFSSPFRKHKPTTSPGLAPLTNPRVNSRSHYPMTPPSSPVDRKYNPTTIPIMATPIESRTNSVQNQSVFRSPARGFYPNTEFLSPRLPHQFGPSSVGCSFETPHPKLQAAAHCQQLGHSSVYCSFETPHPKGQAGAHCQEVGSQDQIDLYDTSPSTRGSRVSSWIRKVVRFRHQSAQNDTFDTTDDDSASAEKGNGSVRPPSPLVDVPFTEP
jgi:hypothetical protein